MSNQLQAAKSKLPTITVQDFFNDKFKQSLIAALPKHITPDKMLRVILTECRRVPKLLQCDRNSFLGCILQCAQLGLTPGSMLQHAHLIPFKNNKKGGIIECTLIVGYRGYLELARRSGQISSFSPRVVREGEVFKVNYGTSECVEHIPLGDPTKPLVAAYFVTRFKDGSYHLELMFKKEIDKIRARSKMPDGAWATDYEEMAKKTVIRRAAKCLPQCPELQVAAELEEQADIGNQDLSNLIDADEPLEIEQEKTTTDKAIAAMDSGATEEDEKIADEVFGDDNAK